MTGPRLTRIAAWLCLALSLLTGLAPGQGLVFCIEEDGCVTIESRSGTACNDCDEHVTEAPQRPSAVAPGEAPSCPCIDIVVPQAREQQIAPARRTGPETGPWIAPLTAVRSEPAAPITAPVRGPPSSVPREPDSLALIRSVVLLR